MSQAPLDKKGNVIGTGDTLVARLDNGGERRYKVLAVDTLQGSGSCQLESLCDPGFKNWASRYDLHRLYEIETKAVHEYPPSIRPTIHTLLEKLPADYLSANFSGDDANGYTLKIGSTIIFQGASAEDAIKHTKNYVEAREGHPDLPVGVIYGIYD